MAKGAFSLYLRLQTLNQWKYFGFSVWAQSNTQTLKSRELSPHEGKRCHRRGIQRNSKREMDLMCLRREDSCEGEERGLSRLRQPQMTVGKETGTLDLQHLGTAFCQQHELGRKSVPQNLWRRVHPSNTDLSFVTLEKPAESSWASAYRTTRRWYTGVVSSHQTWGNKLQAAVKHQHDTPWHQGQTINTPGRQSTLALLPSPPSSPCRRQTGSEEQGEEKHRAGNGAGLPTAPPRARQALSGEALNGQGRGFLRIEVNLFKLN